MKYRYELLNEEKGTTPQFDFFLELGLKSAALFYKNRNSTLMERSSRVLYESYKTLRPFEVERGLPSRFVNQPGVEGDQGAVYGLEADAQGFLWCDEQKLQVLKKRYAQEPVKSAYLEQAVMDAGVPKELYPARYWHCGTHKVADIPWLLQHGYQGYLQKIKDLQQEADEGKRSFLKGMELTVTAILEYIQTCAAAYVQSQSGLAEILSRVPEQPCETFREAVVVIRLLNLFCDSEFGRIDQYLYPYYQKDLEEGRITREEAGSLLADLCYFVDRDGLCWHQVIGGCDRQGNPAYNDLTELILENAVLFAHPHVTLRVNEGMPEAIWEKALYSIGSGCGSPALVQEKIFIEDLVKNYRVPLEEARDFAFAGCSEIVIPGKTNVDSTWCAYPAADILQELIYTETLEVKDYQDFKERWKEQTRLTAEEMTAHVNLRQHLQGTIHPDPVQSLHTAGCLERGKGFWEGGAWYNFDGADIFGCTNVINGMMTMKALLEGRMGVSRERFLKAVKHNFQGEEDGEVLLEIQRLSKFGNGDPEVRKIAAEVSEWLFHCIAGRRIWRGNGYFIPDIIQWTTYQTLGSKMGATADGRRAGEPLADSCGAMPGTDGSGPVKLLQDAAVLPHQRGGGTIILNLKLTPECFLSEYLGKTAALLKGYFSIGGSQIQINVLDEDILRDAWEHPDKHKDLIVRIGGFTDYYYKQSREIQKVILERVSHGVS